METERPQNGGDLIHPEHSSDLLERLTKDDGSEDDDEVSYTSGHATSRAGELETPCHFVEPPSPASIYSTSLLKSKSTSHASIQFPSTTPVQHHSPHTSLQHALNSRPHRSSNGKYTSKDHSPSSSPSQVNANDVSDFKSIRAMRSSIRRHYTASHTTVISTAPLAALRARASTTTGVPAAPGQMQHHQLSSSSANPSMAVADERVAIDSPAKASLSSELSVHSRPSPKSQPAPLATHCDESPPTPKPTPGRADTLASVETASLPVTKNGSTPAQIADPNGPEASSVSQEQPQQQFPEAVRHPPFEPVLASPPGLQSVSETTDGSSSNLASARPPSASSTSDRSQDSVEKSLSNKDVPHNRSSLSSLSMTDSAGQMLTSNLGKQGTSLRYGNQSKDRPLKISCSDSQASNPTSTLDDLANTNELVHRNLRMHQCDQMSVTTLGDEPVHEHNLLPGPFTHLDCPGSPNSSLSLADPSTSTSAPTVLRSLLEKMQWYSTAKECRVLVHSTLLSYHQAATFAPEPTQNVPQETEHHPHLPHPLASWDEHWPPAVQPEPTDSPASLLDPVPVVHVDQVRSEE